MRSVQGYRVRHGVTELFELPPLRYLALEHLGAARSGVAPERLCTILRQPVAR